MGTDNCHHKRKAKTERDFRRQAAKRAPYDKVLIVCEGSKTEPHYFNEIVDLYSLETANVRVSGECGSAPTSVVQHGVSLFKEEKKKGEDFAYDKVYFVFDRDSHGADYHKALDTVKAMKPKNTFFAITSIPCFEYWILLHFEYTTKSFAPTGCKSVCDTVIAQLKKHWPEYEKAAKGTFSNLLSLLETDAKPNAIRALKEAKLRDDDNPSTYVHELVEYLQNIKNPQKQPSGKPIATKTKT